jgi:hypothetical protein
MPIVSIRHRTSYRYRNPVAFGEHRMMLRPQEGFDQRLLAYELDVSPQPSRCCATCTTSPTPAWPSRASTPAPTR